MRREIALGLLGVCAAALAAAQVYTVGGNTIEYFDSNSPPTSTVNINGISTTLCSHATGTGAMSVMYADHYSCLDSGEPPVVVNGLIYVTLNLSSGPQEEVCWEGWRQAQKNYEAATGRAPIPLPPSGCSVVGGLQVFSSAGQRLGQALTIGGPAVPGPVIHEFETWRLPIPPSGARITPTPTPCYVEPQWMRIPCTTTPTPAPQVTISDTPVPTPNMSCPEPIRQLPDGGCACLSERVPCPSEATRTPTKEPSSWTPTPTLGISVSPTATATVTELSPTEVPVTPTSVPSISTTPLSSPTAKPPSGGGGGGCHSGKNASDSLVAGSLVGLGLLWTRGRKKGTK